MNFFLILFLVVAAQIMGSVLSYIFFKILNKNVKLITLLESLLILMVVALLLYEGIQITYLAIISTIIGIAFFAIINKYLPYKHCNKNIRLSKLVFTAMCIHELPEGIAFTASYFINPALGIATAAMIALHNIPEGMILSMPYIVQKKSYKGIAMSIITQLLFTLGAISVYIFSLNLSEQLQALTMTFAAGAMIYIVYEELICIMKNNKNDFYKA